MTTIIYKRKENTAIYFITVLKNVKKFN